MKSSTLSGLAVFAILIGSTAIGLAFRKGETNSPSPAAVVDRQEAVHNKTTESNDVALPPYARREIGRSFVFARGPELRPSGDPRAWIDSLMPAAEAGDAEASYSIYLALMDCEMYLKASAPEELAESESIGASTEYQRTVLRKLLECESILPGQAARTGYWLSKAARQGSIEALVAYAANPSAVLGPAPNMESEEFRAWQSNSISYLHEAIQKGSIDALAQLSNIYMAGYATSRDPQKAYALQLALSEFGPSFSSDSYRNSIARELTPKQISQAREAGREFFQMTTHNKRTISP